MRVWSIFLLLSVLCLSCNRDEAARRKVVQNNLKQISEAQFSERRIPQVRRSLLKVHHARQAVPVVRNLPVFNDG